MNATCQWPIILQAVAAMLVLAMTGCGANEPTPQQNPPAAKTSPPPERSSDKPRRVREPAVAGLFYPKDPVALSSLLDTLLEAAPAKRVSGVKALICPHAGYLYSGPTAAAAYKLLAGREFKTVIVLAPSHYAAFQGVSVSVADVFRTPLGDVPVARRVADELTKRKPFVPEPRCAVHRPPWSAQSSRPLPAPGEDTPDTWEHSDEVQVPFLQKVLKRFEMLTLVLGDVDPEAVARGLAAVLDDHTLIVASSDLSHYHPYDVAKELDGRCVKAICSLDIRQMEKQEACGKSPILTVMNLAKLKGWTAQLLDYRNSGDTSGDKAGGVVGYAAVALCAPEKAGYTREEKKFLMALAKKTVREMVTKGELAKVDEKGLSPKLTQTKACFVTLTKQGRLRGCIGHILPMDPLCQAIIENAASAATRDTRFSPVQADELDKLEFEISILTEPQPLPFGSPEELLQKLRPHQDGVVLQIGPRRSTFLPQVWAQLPDKVEFLNNLALKAGCAASDWRNPGTTVSTYQVESFKESEL